MSYDQECYDLAAKFLRVEPFDSEGNRKRVAQAIQNIIEMQLQDMRETLYVLGDLGGEVKRGYTGG